MATVTVLLEKMSSADKDFRYMGCSDLATELARPEFHMDERLERKVVTAVLSLIQDNFGEVQNLAVKCLPALLRKVSEETVKAIATSLIANMLSEEEQLRDIANLALKALLQELRPEWPSSAKICDIIIASLIGGLQKNDTMLDSLDILMELLSRFGRNISEHQRLLDVVSGLLKAPNQAVRKRSMLVFGSLAAAVPDEKFAAVITFLIAKPDFKKELVYARVLMQCTAVVAREAGERFGPSFPNIVEAATAAIKASKDEELREHALQVLEALAQRCPKDFSPFVEQAVAVCLDLVTFDPNYNYDSDDDMGGNDDEEDEDDAEDYSDDEDVSWKVRRAASRTLSTIVRTRPDLATSFYNTVAPALIKRIKERDETVKVEIFASLSGLVQQAAPYEADTEITALLRSNIPGIIAQSSKPLQHKSVKIRQATMALLKEIAGALPNAFCGKLFPPVIKGVLFSLKEKASTTNVKIDALLLLAKLLQTHATEDIDPHMDVIVQAVVSGIDDGFYLIVGEALTVCIPLLERLRPVIEQPLVERNRGFCKDLFRRTTLKLQSADIDHDVKEKAILATCHVVARAGDVLAADLGPCLKLILQHLNNEITRMAATKGLSIIASSALAVDLSPILGDTIQVLSGLLRKNNRSLRVSALQTLLIVVRKYDQQAEALICSQLEQASVGGAKDVPKRAKLESGQGNSKLVLEEVLGELPPLVSQADVHISQLALNLASQLLVCRPALGSNVSEILTRVVDLAVSPLLQQGAALQAVLDFIKTVLKGKVAGIDQPGLFTMLTRHIYEGRAESGLVAPKQTFFTLAACVATIALADASSVGGFIDKLVRDCSSPSDSVQLLCILSLGEIGRRTDLSGYGAALDVVSRALGAPSEDVKSGASCALGRLAVGNMPFYVPLVLTRITVGSELLYLQLNTLKEIITCQAETAATTSNLSVFVDDIWRLLMKFSNSPEEGTRNVVAECLGRIVVFRPPELIASLKDGLTCESAFARATSVTAIKYTVAHMPRSAVNDALLEGCLPTFFRAIEDSDTDVRRMALVAFNSAAHNRPNLLKNCLNEILPLVYRETDVRKELLRQVDMGPFKHTEDDGLDARKAAFECMCTVLETCPQRLDLSLLTNFMLRGLSDQYDIQMVTYLMLIRLSESAPDEIFKRLDDIADLLNATLTKKLKASAVKQEIEKADELKKSVVRAVHSLKRVPNSEKSPKLAAVLKSIAETPSLKLQLDILEGNAAPMDESQ